MKCHVCDARMSTAEVAAYRERCEDCWARLPLKAGPTLQTTDGYSQRPVGEMAEITNQKEARGGATRFFQRRRRDK